MNRHDFGLGRIHESESLLVHRWVLLGSSSPCGLRAVAGICDGTFIRNLIEIGEVLALALALVRLEGLEQPLRGATARVSVEKREVLRAVVDQLIHEEQKVSLAPEELPGDVFVLAAV